LNSSVLGILFLVSCNKKQKISDLNNDIERYELASKMCSQEIVDYNQRSFEFFLDSLNRESDFFGLRDLRDYVGFGEETQEEKILRIWDATHKTKHIDSLVNQYASILSDNSNYKGEKFHVKRSTEVASYKHAVVIDFVFYIVADLILIIVCLNLIRKSMNFIFENFSLILFILLADFIISLIWPFVGFAVSAVFASTLVIFKKIRRIIMVVLFIFSLIVGFYLDSKLKEHIISNINESYSEQANYYLIETLKNNDN